VAPRRVACAAHRWRFPSAYLWVGGELEEAGEARQRKKCHDWRLFKARPVAAS